MKKSIVMMMGLTVLFSAGLQAASNNDVVTMTKFWSNIPIKINDAKQTYTIVAAEPEVSIEYYYSFPGFRCFNNKMDVTSNKEIRLTAGFPGGRDLYCYSE